MIIWATTYSRWRFILLYLRYERSIWKSLDEHQGFQAEKSGFHYNCLQIPFLNIAIQQFWRKKLKNNFHL